MKKFKTAIQLYSLREQLKHDFHGTIKAVKNMGFDGVEFAWQYGELEPSELAAFMRSVGLQACGMHAGTEELSNPASTTYRYAAALECRYVTTSLMRLFPDNIREAVDLCRTAGETAAALGHVFTYHNHAQELLPQDGEPGLSILLHETDPETVKAELDTYWIKKGGGDPLAWVEKYAGRLPELHIKDMDASTGEFAVPGTGILDFPAIVAAAGRGVTEWLIYELDACKGDPMEAAASAARHLRQLAT